MLWLFFNDVSFKGCVMICSFCITCLFLLIGSGVDVSLNLTICFEIKRMQL